MFYINTARDFYEMLVQDYDDFAKNPTSARKALHCATTAYHLNEWVWGEWLKRDNDLKAKLGVKSHEEFLAFIDRCCPWFPTIQALTNGTKHFGAAKIDTSLVSGFGQGPFGLGTFSKGYLLIDHGGPEDVHRFKTAADLLEVVVRFWRDFFKSYNNAANLPESEHHLKPI